MFLRFGCALATRRDSLSFIGPIGLRPMPMAQSNETLSSKQTSTRDIGLYLSKQVNKDKVDHREKLKYFCLQCRTWELDI